MKRVARTLFTYSLSYLFVIFLALIVDHVGHDAGVDVDEHRARCRPRTKN